MSDSRCQKSNFAPLASAILHRTCDVLLTSADQCNDFEPITVAKYGVGMLGARDNFQVQLDGNMRRRDAQFAKQLGDGERVGDGAWFSVDLDRHRLFFS